MLPNYFLTAFAVLAATLVLGLALHPPRTLSRASRIATFAILFVLPLLVTMLGGSAHLEHSKSTQFCLSCHEMEPYGRSLEIDDPEYLPAGHFQNRRVDSETACYDCHTTYTMYGDISAKLKGLRHVWVHFTGTLPETIELYEPYSNRECLHCHAGARRFEEDELHMDFRAEFETGETTCLECHDLAHDVDALEDLELWQPETADG